MKSYYFSTIDEFIESCADKEVNYLLLVAENTLFSHSQISQLSVECYGAVFPEIIYEENHFKEGLIVTELEIKPALVQNMDTPSFKDTNIENIDSMLVFVDGLSAYIDSFLFSLFESIDEDCILFGGGAGKLTLKQEKVIFSPEGIFQDAALIVSLPCKVNVGVNHGWEFLKGPYIATATDKNILKKIDYEDAFEVYKGVVEEDSGVVFNDENFFDISKSYPLGIVTIDGEVIVRDPIVKENKALVLVGVMPENSVINILKGKKSSLIEAASHATESAIKSSCELDMVFMIDCISRVLFLEDAFKEEIGSIKKKIGRVPLVGALTLGEIANNSKEYIDFYNKTCVVGALCS